MSKFVELKYKNQTLRINTRGGGIAEYYIKKDNRRDDIIYGYSDEKDYDGGMGDILSPFPGRVDRGRYSYQGGDYQLNGFAENKGNSLHAFVRELNWIVEKISDNQIASTVEVKEQDFSEKGFPFSLEFNIIYEILDDGLSIKTDVKNIGDKTVPFGIGYHPYFKVATKVDDMIWQVPAKSVVEFDDSLKPTGKLIPVEESNLDFRTPARIGGRVIDNCFTDLIRDEKDIFTSKLSSEDGSKGIEIWQDSSYPYFQTYSSDTITPKNRRQAMALEPQSCCGFAINMPELGLIHLEKGEEFCGRWGIRWLT